MNKEEQMSALIGDKLLDFLLYEEMNERMPDLSVSNIISIRHRLASNEYLSKVWDILYKNDFIDNYTIHQKGTMIEMQLTKAYKENNQVFIKKCIKELLWFDIYTQFVENKKVKTQNAETNTNNDIIERKSIQIQACVKTKIKENQTNISNIQTKNQQVQTIDQYQQKHSILNSFFHK